MSLNQHQWAEVAELEGAALKQKIFSILQELSYEIQTAEIDDPLLLGSIPRLVDLVATRTELSSYREIVSALARSTGLWNYIDKRTADSRDLLVAEAVTVPELDGITLHREQIVVLNSLFDGKNIILSAPTSFGKSILIDALLASGKFNRVAIVLPTIALLDEFRRRLTKRFGSTFQIIMYHSEIPKDGPVIFLGTQERLITRNDIRDLDLAVVDEFYKLDPTRQDERSLTLNAAVYRLLRNAKQFFFLGPNVENVRVSPDSRWHFQFLRTRFSTVAVDTFDIYNVSDKEVRLTEEAYRDVNWPALVFVSSPDRANRLARHLANSGPAIGAGREMADWIDTNFGNNWEISSFVQNGLGVHHARIPRAVAAQFVRMFNEGALPVLICTSTLIEGVNTAAKSVMIYDKAINRANYDFFTFSNIRGRAGRLGQHHVGQVYLFHTPPDKQDVEVTPPLFGDLDEAPDEIVVHIDAEEASPRMNERVDLLRRTLGLSLSELRLASSVGLDDTVKFKRSVDTASKEGAMIHWSGLPGYRELLGVCTLVCGIRAPSEFGLWSDKQLAFFINKLRQSGTMKNFFIWYSSSYRGDQISQDNVFKFLRACEYGLPQIFALIEIFARSIDERTDYSLLLSGLPRWFRPEILKQLDEQGIPIQISERFYKADDDLESLSIRLARAAANPTEILSNFESRWISDALPGY